MQTLAWLVLMAVAAMIAFSVWLMRKRWLARSRAAEDRMASFAAQTRPAPAKNEALPQQKLLFEAAAKAAEAGEPALSIQLYARLVARYPDSGFTPEARAAVEAQKKKLAKA